MFFLSIPININHCHFEEREITLGNQQRLAIYFTEFLVRSFVPQDDKSLSKIKPENRIPNPFHKNCIFVYRSPRKSVTYI